jgi:hypothetical protein
MSKIFDEMVRGLRDVDDCMAGKRTAFKSTMLNCASLKVSFRASAASRGSCGAFDFAARTHSSFELAELAQKN